MDGYMHYGWWWAVDVRAGGTRADKLMGMHFTSTHSQHTYFALSHTQGLQRRSQPHESKCPQSADWGITVEVVRDFTYV